jgi:hypothetical protein
MDTEDWWETSWKTATLKTQEVGRQVQVNFVELNYEDGRWIRIAFVSLVLNLWVLYIYEGHLKSSWTGGSALLLCQVVVVGVT